MVCLEEVQQMEAPQSMTFMINNGSVFVDSSAWISFSIINDSNHHKAESIFSSIKIKPLFISFFIISEVITKLRKIVGQKETNLVFKHFKKLEIKKRLTILPVNRDIIEVAFDLLQNHPTPNTFSLTDATNIVLMKQYKIPTLFSFDRDFRKLKIPNLLIIP